MLAEPDAPSARRARSARIDQFDAGVLKRGNQFHERIDVGADDAVAGFHALNGRNRKVRQTGGLPLIDIQEGTGGPELIGGDHGRRLSQSRSKIFLHRVNTGFKHQFEYIIYQWREWTPTLTGG